ATRVRGPTRWQVRSSGLCRVIGISLGGATGPARAGLVRVWASPATRQIGSRVIPAHSASKTRVNGLLRGPIFPEADGHGAPLSRGRHRASSLDHSTPGYTPPSMRRLCPVI